MAKKKARKSRKTKASKDLAAESQIGQVQAVPYMVSIPIDVIYSLNSSSIGHISENYVKEEPTETETNSSNRLQEEAGSHLDSEMLILDEGLAVRRRSSENVSPARTVIKKEFCESTDIDFPLNCNSNCSSAISPTLSSSTVAASSRGQHIVSDLISENPAPALNPASSACTNIEAEPSDERVIRHNANFTEPVSNNLSESTRFNLSPSGMVTQDEKLNHEIATERNSNLLPRKHNDQTNTDKANIKYAVKMETEISRIKEESSYMATIPIDVIYSVNSSTFRNCSENYAKEEPTETDTNSCNGLHEEAGSYLDSEMREVRRRFSENVSPARTIIKEELNESNNIDLNSNCNINCSSPKDLLSDNDNITRLPNNVSQADHTTSCVQVILSPNSMSLTSINERTASSPKELVTPREIAAPMSYSTIIATDRISPRQTITTRQPKNPTELMSPKRTISSRESIDLSPTLSFTPTVTSTPRGQHTVADLISENSACATEQSSSEVLRHNAIFADPLSSSNSSPWGKLIQDEPRNPEIATNSHYTFSPEQYSSHLSRKRSRSRSNELHSKHKHESADECELLLSFPRKRLHTDQMIANITPVYQLERAYSLNQNKQSPEFEIPSSGKRLHYRKSKRRRRSDKSSKNQYKPFCGAKYKYEAKSGKRERLKPSPATNYNEIRSSAKCYSPNVIQPCASTYRRKNNPWHGIRFSISPEVSPTHTSERSEDSDSDYGWEYPPPPKLQPTDPILEDMNPDQLQKKLTELDLLIQNEKDNYVRQLFNTENFDDWDDDPALSNIKTAAKFKLCKQFLPAGTGLLEKMNLAPFRDYNHKSVGVIKQIESEYQGREIPSHLLNLIKQEKKTISNLVIKYLMPYYDAGKIQPENIFKLVARNISHVFYERFAGEIDIMTYIDDLFKEASIIDLT